MHDKQQFNNPIPQYETEKEKKQGTDLKQNVLDHRSNLKLINFLEVGDVFGEIALLTNMKRTCFVFTNECCIFQTISKEQIEQIQERFPQLRNRIYENMFKYHDEDMNQKKYYVFNIPYLRGLDFEIIQRIVYLQYQQVYE